MEVRKENLLRVLKVVRSNPGISIPEVAHMIGLTTVTVNSLIHQLLEKDIVREDGLSKSTGGRKAQSYSFNKDCKKMFGIGFHANAIFVNLFNLCGEDQIEMVKLHFGPNSNVEDTIFAVVQTIQDILARASLTVADILGVGITVPGIVDAEKGIIINLPRLPKWSSFPIAAKLRQELGIPVFLEKDSIAYITYMKWEGVIGTARNSAYLGVSIGIGSAIMIDRKPYRGNHGLAGEIGHIPMGGSTYPCHCGNVGCIDAITSFHGIIRHYFDLLEADKLIAKDRSAFSLGELDESEYICKLARGECEFPDYAEKAFMHAIHSLTTLVYIVLAAYDTSVIVIESCWMKEQGERYFNMLKKQIFGNWNTLLTRNDVNILLNTADLVKATYAVTIEKVFADINNILIN